MYNDHVTPVWRALGEGRARYLPALDDVVREARVADLVVLIVRTLHEFSTVFHLICKISEDMRVNRETRVLWWRFYSEDHLRPSTRTHLVCLVHRLPAF